MPKYKRRDPEYTAIQFTGSNIREVLYELGPEYRTPHSLDLENAETFSLIRTSAGGHQASGIVRKGQWIVVDRELESVFFEWDDAFRREYEPVKRPGRPAKEKK